MSPVIRDHRKGGRLMSTYWGFVCRSHDPEIESEHWFNRGAAVLADAFQKERSGEILNNQYGEPTQTIKSPLGTYETFEPIYWLRQHPRCDVALRSEYGDTREIANQPKEAH